MKSWVIFILCFGCGDPPQRQQFDSLRSCQEAIATGQFIAGPGVAVVAFCGLERSAELEAENARLRELSEDRK